MSISQDIKNFSNESRSFVGIHYSLKDVEIVIWKKIYDQQLQRQEQKLLEAFIYWINIQERPGG